MEGCTDIRSLFEIEVELARRELKVMHEYAGRLPRLRTEEMVNLK